LENWRNFTKVDVPKLQRRVFLAGPNASGKSNLLDVFRFLREVVTLGGGLQKAVQNRGGVSKIRCLAARRFPEVAIKVNIGNKTTRPEWSYQVSFTQDKKRRAVLKHEIVEKAGREIRRRPDESDKRDPEQLTQTHLEQINLNKEFRDIADFFRSVRYLHVVPQLIREPDRFTGESEDPFGGDFLEQIAATNKKTRQSRLRKITEVLKVAVPQLKKLQLDRDSRGVPHLQGLYEHWRPQAGWQAEDQFSDGTLRLFGLLWSILDGSGPILLEEPELSLHPDVVRHIPQMFARLARKKERQVIVSTHSSDLLSDTGLAADEVLLLFPGKDGTEVRTVTDDYEIVTLLESGFSMADVVLPKTAPVNASQLSLFGDWK
jgi:predicted ATPase